MQRDNLSKSILSILITGITLVLVGCGAAGSSGPITLSTPSSISGVVSDGAIHGAKVWLDINEDGLPGPSEAFAISDPLGQFKITFKDADIPTNVLIRAMGGTDNGTNSAFEGILEAKAVSSSKTMTQMLTPLTTLMAKGLKPADIRALLPELPEGDLNLMNPNENPKLETHGAAIHSTIAMLTEAAKEERTNKAFSDIYGEFARKFLSQKGAGQKLELGDIPIDEIIRENGGEVDPDKTSAIKTMILSTSLEMIKLTTQADFIDKVRDLQSAAMNHMRTSIGNFIKTTLSKDDFMAHSKKIRDEIIKQQIEQVMNANPEEIAAIQKQIRDEIEANFNLDFEQGSAGAGPEASTDEETFNQVKVQIEQSITQEIQNTITSNFINSQGFGGSPSQEEIEKIRAQIEGQISSQTGFNPEKFREQFGSFLPKRP